MTTHIRRGRPMDPEVAAEIRRLERILKPEPRQTKAVRFLAGELVGQRKAIREWMSRVYPPKPKPPASLDDLFVKGATR